LNLAEMRDAEKVCFLDAPISQAGLFGETVEDFAQQFSTVKEQTEAIKYILPRRAASASPAPPKQQPPPPTRAAQAPQPAVLQLDPPNSPALVGRPLRTLVRLRSTPETGSPGKRDRLTCPDPHSTRGRALDSAPTRLSATWTCGHTPPVRFSPQGNPLVSFHGTIPPGKTASGLRGFSNPATRRFPSHSAPILGT
ncbi:hypothetical protein M9458_018884, partial [Cirrhinus mrigala]